MAPCQIDRSIQWTNQVGTQNFEEYKHSIECSNFDAMVFWAHNYCTKMLVGALS